VSAGPSPVEHIIVVDDDPVIRGILRSTLAGIGMGVHLASNGTEAIALAARVKAGLFMMDLLMPGVNGRDTCRHLRNLADYVSTPIVVLTGYSTPSIQNAAFAAGATMVLSKPFKPTALLQAIAPLLGGNAPAEEYMPSTKLDPQTDLWGLADPEYRNQVWGRLDAERAANRLALGTSDLGLD
jgi:CheY-like chemotaxis protein